MGAATGSDAHVYWNGQHVGTFTSVEQSTENPTLETTTLGLTDRTFISSKLRNNTFSGNLFYDPNDSAAASMIGAIDSNTTTSGTLKIEWLKGTGIAVREGNAIINQRGTSVSVGDLLQVSVSVQFTGGVSGTF
jgi:hypothetical protein